MRISRKIKIEDEIPQDIRFHVNAIAKRFRLKGMNYTLVKKYLNDKIIEEVLNVTNQSLYKAAQHLGITYTSLYLTMKRKKEKMEKDFGCGKN